MSRIFSLLNKKIWVAGHKGMVGSALCRRLAAEGSRILTSTEDLRHQESVERWVDVNKPDVVVMAAARVGGIKANSERPAEFLYDNLMIAGNVIHASYKAGVEKLLFLGSSCIYPRDAAQPLREESLLTGALEPTNEAYAIAKIAGVKLCQSYHRQHGCDYIAAMPCNLYGPGDTYDAQKSHVIPALIMKFDYARRNNLPFVTVGGTGHPLREFLYVDDLAQALILLLERYSGADPVNIGSGEEISIAVLAQKIAVATGYEGDIRFDPAYPDGTPRKILDSSKIRQMGWHPATKLESGLQKSHVDYLAQVDHVRAA